MPVREWLVLATNVAVDAIDWLTLVLVAVGAVEAFFQGLWTMFSSRDGHFEREVWLRLGRWLVAGLTFQLAADVLETAITARLRAGLENLDGRFEWIFCLTGARVLVANREQR